jgi:UPF0176 protein
MTKSIINVSAYKFVQLTELEQLRDTFYADLKDTVFLGTILLAEEGINLMLAGERDAIDHIKQYLSSFSQFSDMEYKETISEAMPFDRFKIKIKTEIVPMGVASVKPTEFTGPTISAQELKRWLDEGRDFTLLDTRNTYEIAVGTFESAIDLNLRHFRDFAEAVDHLPAEQKEKPLVMFCTGGIRCEKASPLLLQKGFKEVYQLDGGILKYFQEVGGSHWRGDCFIFDQRTSITPTCDETGLAQCERCQEFVTAAEQKLTNYKRGDHCIHCMPKTNQQSTQSTGENTWA